MGSTTEVHPPQPFNTTIDSTIELPDSNSPDLHLAHPTPEECITIWTSTSASWRDSLTLPVYLTESQFLTTVPLAKDGGMTIWILDDKNLPLNKRPILCSCESFRKRSLTSDAAGNVRENIVHGIASVFCAPQYRRRGYAARHMKEMAKILRHWQAEHGEPVGSVLYSDIGKEYYARLGWIPNATNTHFVFPPHRNETPQLAREILEDDLQALCDQDKVTIRGAMATPADAVSKRATILPDLDHMLWHIGKECFAAHHPDQGADDNVLYILRLVVEGDATANKALASTSKYSVPAAGFAEQAESLKVVLQAAQREAVEWRLNHVKLWEPSPLARSLIVQSGLDFEEVERQEDSIASGLWYGDGGEAPAWINNEHYAWC